MNTQDSSFMPGPTKPNQQDVENAEKIEKNKKILRLYQKAILNEEFETADQLDISEIPFEELKQVRIRAYDQLILKVNDNKKSKYYWDSYKRVAASVDQIQKNIHIELSEIKDVRDKFLKDFINIEIDVMFQEDRDRSKDIIDWAKDNNFGREETKQVIDAAYLRYQKYLITESDRLFKYAYEHRNDKAWRNDNQRETNFKRDLAEAENFKINLPLANSTSLDKIPKEISIDYTIEEKKKLQEAGFIAVLDEKAPYSYDSKEQIDFALKVSNLTEQSLSSEYIQKILVDKFTLAIKNISFEKSDNKYSPYSLNENSKLLNEIECLSKSVMFPKKLDENSETQNIIDSKFVEMVNQLKINDEAFTQTEYIKEESKGHYGEETVEQKYSYRYIDKLVKFSKLMKVSENTLKSTDMSLLASCYIKEYFKDLKGENVRNFSLDIETLKKLEITSEYLNSQAENCYLNTIKTHDSTLLNKIIDLNINFTLSKQFKQADEVLVNEVDFLENLAVTKATWTIKQFLEIVDLPKETINSPHFIEIKQKIILTALSEGSGSLDFIKFMSEKFGFEDLKEFLKTENVQEKIKEILIKDVNPIFKKILGDMYWDLHRPDLTHNYSPSLFGEKEALVVYNTKDYFYINRNTRPDGIDGFLSAINSIKYLNNQELTTSEFSHVFSEHYGHNQDIDTLSNLYKISDNLMLFGIKKESLRKIIFDLLVHGVGKNKYTEPKDPERYNSGGTWLFVPKAIDLEKLKIEYKFDDEQMKRLALESFNYFLRQVINNRGSDTHNNQENARDIFNKYKLSPLEINPAAKDLYYMYVTKGWTEAALETKKNFNLEIDSTELDTAIRNTFINSLKNENVDIRQAESLTVDFLKTIEVQKLGKELFLKQLSKGYESEARKTKSVLLLDISVEDIIKESPQAEMFLHKIQEKFPNLAKKYFNSVDAFISIYSQIGNERIFSTLDEYPFLGDALMNNEQYGLKLLFKFDSLDKLSKTNIETLYKNRSDIIKERPGIDVESRDFRIAMQNRLGEYRRNPEIISSMKKSGINVEEWLNHEDETYFELGRDRLLKFSDTITTPIERIQETINHYGETVKEVLGQFEKELTAFRININDPEQLKNELSALQILKQKAEQEGNTKKADGIARGIANLEGQIVSSQTQSLWTKLIGSLLTVDLVKKDVFTAYNLLRENEEKIFQEQDITVPEDKKKKEFIKLKTKIESLKKELKEKFALLETRMEKVQSNLQPMISPALGEERAVSLMQEIKEKVVENMDHYDSDRTTLANLFAEKEEKGLDGQQMKISIWNRDPDKDLYLGNYTDCCIRIDSEHMGEESTIADYLTDLGIQIVTISDEKKNIPVVAAWCWIGHDNDDRTAFVIDNIEANTEYSGKYRQQLQDKLMYYLQNYAEKVGLHITQGTSNNDLVVSEMDSTYFKLGGYNRASGYYLEAEDLEVNLPQPVDEE